jgi:hypothetical protein
MLGPRQKCPPSPLFSLKVTDIIYGVPKLPPVDPLAAIPVGLPVEARSRPLLAATGI